jgi:membrane-bound serine protease (ClpP class)
LILDTPGLGKSSKAKIAMTGPASSREIALKVGNRGKVVSALRPAGWARFEEQMVNVVAEAQFLEIDDDVEIIKIEGKKVVVRKVEN